MQITRENVKQIAGIAAEYGSAVIVSGIIANNVSADRIDRKIATVVAGFAIGGVLGAIARKRIQEDIDDAANLIADVKAKKSKKK